jgi:hypothetical protein
MAESTLSSSWESRCASRDISATWVKPRTAKADAMDTPMPGPEPRTYVVREGFMFSVRLVRREVWREKRKRILEMKEKGRKALSLLITLQGQTYHEGFSRHNISLFRTVRSSWY